MSAWQPTAEQHKALRLAANSLRAHQHPMWRDDLMQAGRIALWRAGDVDGASSQTVAQRAMVSELRRLHGRDGQARNGKEHVEFSDELHETADQATPDQHLALKQTLAQLTEAAARCVSIIWNGGTQKDAARALGVTPTRVCQLLTPLRRALEAA